MKEIRKYLAEFIGTLVLVLFACGVAGQTCAPANEGSGYLITAFRRTTPSRPPARP